jgi:hypothetical protein
MLATHFEAQAFWAAEVDRLDETVVDGSDELHTAAADAITYRQDLVKRVHMQCDMLCIPPTVTAAVLTVVAHDGGVRLKYAG